MLEHINPQGFVVTIDIEDLRTNRAKEMDMQSARSSFYWVARRSRRQLRT